ncbi:unnamed protein product [Linum trigynum]|uniref:Uncharacterized protein n=1 Tax=Linum trigynum TaxID=586398 RepID=A0AAV2DVQ6_9ROSI
MAAIKPNEAYASAHSAPRRTVKSDKKTPKGTRRTCCWFPVLPPSSGLFPRRSSRLSPFLKLPIELTK